MRARLLVEAAMAEVRQAAKCMNEHAKDAAQKVTEELQRLQSPVKGKQQLVSTSFLLVVIVLKIPIGQCYTGEGERHTSEGERHASEGERHAGEGEGFAGSCEEWQVEMEGELSYAGEMSSLD